MSEANPFRAPEANLETPSESYAARLPGHWGEPSLVSSFEGAVKLCLERPGLFATATILGWLMLIVFALTIIGIPLLIPALFWGMQLFSLNFVRGKAQIGDLLSGFSNYLSRTLGAGLLLLVTVFASSLISIPQWLAKAQWGGSLAMPLEVVGTVIQAGLTARIYLASAMLVDRELSFTDSLKLSWQTTRGYGLRLTILAAGWNLLSLVCASMPTLLNPELSDSQLMQNQQLIQNNLGQFAASGLIAFLLVCTLTAVWSVQSAVLYEQFMGRKDFNESLVKDS